MRYPLNQAHLETFKKYCEKWVGELSLHGFLTSYNFLPKSAGAMAGAHVNTEACRVRFGLARSWGQEPTDAEIERCAFHECLHVLLSQYREQTELRNSDMPKDKYERVRWSSDREARIDRVEETVVVTLENLFARLLMKPTVTFDSWQSSTTYPAGAQITINGAPATFDLPETNAPAGR